MELTKCPMKATVYRLTAGDNDPDRHKCHWVDYTLEFQFRRLLICSDSGNYSYSWGHDDEDSLMNLLSRAEYEYLLSKISNKSVFDLKTSKEQLIEYVKSNSDKYGVDKTKHIIEDIKDMGDYLIENEYLYQVQNIVPKIDYESIPVYKDYPYNAKVVIDMFMKYVQPQIKKDFESSKIKIGISYTSDNESTAIEEVKSILKRIEDMCLLSLKVKDSKRACRNANGKELTKQEFEAIDPDSDDAWFDDYDFTMEAEIDTLLDIDEVLARCDDEGLSVYAIKTKGNK